MADDLQLSIRLAMESASFEQQITNINRQMRVVQSEFNAASTALGGFGSETQRLEAQQASLTRQVDLTRQKVDTLRTTHESARQTLERNVIANTTLRQRVEATTRALNASVTATGQSSEESQRLQTELNQLNTEFAQSNATIVRNNANVDNLNIRLQNAQTQQNRLQTELTQTNRDLQLQNSNWTHLSETLNTASANMQAVGKKMTDIGKTMSVAITAPLVAAGGAAIKLGMDFDSAMSRVKAISSSTEEEFKALEKAALDLGASSAFSATQVAGAQESMASAGFKVNEILAATPGVLDLAASSGEDLAVASTIAAGAIRGFGLEASESGHVADVLARAAADTNAGVASMGEAFKYVAPLARAVGWDIESVAAAVGSMADANIDGSTSGTTLRGVISRLANPADPAATAMDKLGFSAFDAQGKMKPLSTIADELSKSMENLTDEQKQENISTIFGQEAMSGLMVLMQKGKPALDELSNGFKNCDGTAQEMAKTMQDNAKASIDGMMGSLETAAIKIEQIAAPNIRKFAEKVSELANKFSELSPELQQTILKVALVVAAIGPVLVIMGTLISSIGSIVGAFGAMSGAIAAAGGIMAILTAPLTLVIAAIAALVVGVIYAYTHIEGFRKIVDESWSFISKKTKEVFEEYIMPFLKSELMPLFQKVFGTIGDVVKGTFTAIKLVWDTILKPLFDKVIMPYIQDVLLPTWKIVFDTIGGVVKSVFGTIGELWNKSFKPIFNGILDFISGTFTGDWSKTWNGVSEIFKGVWEGMKTIAKTPINFIIGGLNGFINGINKIKIPSWVPEAMGGGKGFNIPNIPSFAVGTRYLPNDMIAQVHKGEMIVPKSENPYANSGGKTLPNNGITIKIENFVNNRKQDVEAFAQELEFYRKQQSQSIGGD